MNAAKEAGLAEGRKAGREAERARFAAILGCEEAKGRQVLALSLASESDMEVEAAKKILAASPVAVEKKGGAFEQAMAATPNPKVGAGGEGGGGDDAAEESKKTLAAYYGAMGVKK